MKTALLYGFLLFLLLVGGAPVASAEEVRISAAASLTDVIKQLVADYQLKQPDLRLLPNFASSGALAKQIAVGAPADIYISANPKWMQHLQQQGLIAEQTVHDLVQNSLVVVGTSALVKTFPDLSKLQRIALGSPKSTPVGRYAEQAMTAAGLYPQLLAGKNLVFAKDVRQALMYADRGEVDAAFVYKTDAMLAENAQILCAVPQDLYPRVVYPAALTKSGRQNAAASGFFNYLFSREAQQVYNKFGFLTP